MADHSTIQTTSPYATLLALLHERMTDLAKALDGVGTNLPTGAVRWDSAAKKWRKWNGSAWVDLTDVFDIKNTAANTKCNAVMGKTNVQGALEALAGVIPAGTRMLFQQSTAPTGWTKITDHNNKALRVVSGTASYGGALDFTSAFAASRAVSYTTAGGQVGNTTLNQNTQAIHKHNQTVYQPDGWSAPTIVAGSAGYHAATVRTLSNIHDSSGGTGHNHSFIGTAHNHTLDLSVKYVDIIIARKN